MGRESKNKKIDVAAFVMGRRLSSMPQSVLLRARLL